jgi:hypothetical protein
MAVATLVPVNRTPGTVLAKALGPVPPGEEWSVSVRICASGIADDAFDLRLRKTDGTNAAYRCKGHRAVLGTGTYDVETRLTLPEGYELWDRSEGGAVDASYTGTKRQVA